MLNRIKLAILNRLWFNHFKPKMVLGYKRKQDNVYLANTRISNTTAIAGEQNLNIGDHVFIGHHNFIDASNGLTIGKGCQITNFVSILTHSSHIAIRLYADKYIENNGKHIGYVKGETLIGNYCFIGPHSVIMPGVKLGIGSVVSAYSYVDQGQYPDYAILAGNPAKVVGDSSSLDQAYLEEHPELKAYYQRLKN